MTEIQFKSFLPELTKDMPIIKASKYRYAWYKRAVQDLKKDTTASSTAKCPGIISVNATGWIQRAYQDFDLEVLTENNIRWTCAIDQFRAKPGGFVDYIDGHSPEQYYKYNPDAFKQTCHTIIKVNSPWYVVIPDGYSLLSMPIPYNDENRIVAATGILIGKQFLNVQLFVKAKPGSDIIKIKAGTPLQQYILIKNEEIKTSLHDYTLEDEELLCVREKRLI
jgi:hypothetical protein